MRNLALTFWMCFFILHLQAQAGRIKIYFAGFTCNQETWDDAMQLDGKGDEVFLTFQFALSDANGNIKLKGEHKTQTFGDATGTYSNRINVGSCVDMFGGQKGGIKAGDQYMTNVAIGEFDITATDILTISPVIWEWDPNQNALNTFLPKLKAATTELNFQTSKFLGSTNNQIDPLRMNASEFISKTIFFFSFFLSSDLYSSIESFVGKQETRPIGMDPTGKFVPTVIALNSQRVAFNSNNNIGYGLGVLPITFDENALGNTREHGNYRILIRTEFILSPNQTTTTVTAVAPTSSQIIMPTSTATFQTATPVQTSTSTTTNSNTNTTTTTPTTSTTSGTQSNGNGSSGRPSWKPGKK